MNVAQTVVYPASKLGEYIVIQDIAEGTYGKVKMARHVLTGYTVAMKYISKAVIHRERTKTRVRREFEYMRALHHPHIIKLYEVISTPTDIIFVLEYARGELFNHIVANGSLEEHIARRFFQQLISGIEYSHRLKIVHRDLKPENVLLDEANNVKIADFGLSNAISDGDFLSTSCGSPNYAAPEVIRGGVYAGPEIDVWSSGVILFVMLCGRLPFEDEDVQRLFAKIMQGSFHLPPHVSPTARNLINAMLAVDPIKRITINEITQHPFFTADLPRYLSPLPPPPGPVLGTLAALVTPPKVALNFEIIEGLGRIEIDVIDELTASIQGASKEDVWDCLRRDDGIQGNAVKVAYMLLRDKHRAGKDSFYAEQERDAQLAALDPRNAVSPNALSPGADPQANPFDAEFGEEYDAYDDEGIIEDDAEYVAAQQQQQQQLAERQSVESSFAVLGTSYVSATGVHQQPHHGREGHGQQAQGGRRRTGKTKWHFGIRSRSPPMEVMLEIYRTLKAMGMEWKEKKGLGGLGGKRRVLRGTGGRGIERAEEMDGEGNVDMKAASTIYFVETRARVQDTVILMNLQLYQVDSINYLVDFHHKKSYRASTEPGAGKFDMAVSPDSDEMERNRASEREREKDKDGVIPEEDVVVSPYMFMDLACKLILELAGGSE